MLSTNSMRIAYVQAAIAVILAAPAAYAQQDDSAGRVLEEIVVTALKRSSTVQETPVSITAVSGDMLERLGADDFIDYANSIPGLTLVDQGPGERRLVIRGINGVGESQVGLYYDETFVTGAPGAEADSGARQPDFKLVDIDRVEVLRGPQGTLYGAGSVGGTLRVITNKPDASGFDAFVEADLSNTKDGSGNYELSGMVNLPLVDDTLAARVVAYYRDESGYVDNIALGNTNINFEETVGGRAALRWQPSDSFTLDLTAMLQRTDTGGRPEFFPGVGDLQTDRVTQEILIDDTDIFNATLSWDLGFANLVASASYYERFVEFNFDTTPFIAGFDNNAICAIQNGQNPATYVCTPAEAAAHTTFINSFLPATVKQPQNVDNFTSEVRLSSTGDGMFDWTVGFFAEDRSSDLKSQVLAATPDGLARVPFEFIFFRQAVEDVDQISFFGEVTYHITDRFRLTGGGRWFDYDKTNRGETIVGFSLVNAPPGPAPDGDAGEDGTIFKVNASYDLTDDVMTYFQVVEGFRLGGANQSVFVQVPPQFDSDSVINYELGVKSTLLDGSMTLNAALFRMDWENVQVQGTTPDGAFAFIGNAGEAEVEGIEIEVTSQPLDNLLLSGGFTYLTAELTENQVDASGDFRAPGLAGDEIPRVPDLTFGAAAEVYFQLPANLDGSLRLDISHVDSRNTELRPDDPFFLEIDDYTLVNLRFGFAGERWSGQVYAHNLFDEDGQSNRAFSQFTDRSIFATRPQTFGVSVRHDF